MTFSQYMAILLKWWKLVVLCFLLVGAGALAASLLMKPLYQSSTLLEVNIIPTNTSSSAYDNVLASQQLVQTLATVATSNAVLGEVAARYPGLTVSELAQEVTATPRASTQLFDITVLDPSSTRAASLANDIAAAVIQRQQQMSQQANLQQQQHVQAELNQTSQQITTVTGQIASLKAQKGADAGQIAILQAQLTGLQQQYSQLQATLGQLQLAQAQYTNPLSVIQPATPSANPAQPNRILLTGTGLAVGLVLGLLLALVVEMLDTRVRTPEALHELLNWPIVGTIWRVKSQKGENVTRLAERNSNVESFRLLRTNIGLSRIDKPVRTLVVTSPLPNEGKSTVAANLAIFMARTGKNTLLIDANLHIPIQHKTFALPPNAQGLSNALLAFSALNGTRTLSWQQSAARMPNESAEPSLESFVHRTNLSNLWIMPSGPLPPNPSELLESKAMQRFLNTLESSPLDSIIIDTSSLLGLSDTGMLVARADATLLVVDMTNAKKGPLLKAKTVLEQAGARVLGCVANKQRHSHADEIYDYALLESADQDGAGRSSSSSSSRTPGAQSSGSGPVMQAPVAATPLPPAPPAGGSGPARQAPVAATPLPPAPPASGSGPARRMSPPPSIPDMPTLSVSTAPPRPAHSETIQQDSPRAKSPLGDPSNQTDGASQQDK
jgi:Mrp family chromosome partitioning ATPase/capsular polysaccharide biosynthesis protein